MNEAIIFKRRNKIKKDVVITSNVLLCAYKTLSDGAKITYQVIDGYDWEDKETKTSKGYVFPATETLARMRDATDRTIRRHIKELIEAKLLTRIRRRNQPSILYIEDVSGAEIKNYLKKREHPKSKRPKKRTNQSGSKTPSKELSTRGDTADRDTVNESRTDIFVFSGCSPERTKMSVAYMKANKGKANEINVNEDFNKDPPKRNGKAGSIGTLLRSYKLLQPKQTGKLDKYLARDYIAEKLTADLNDQKSLGCYRIIASKIPQHIIFQALGSVREVAEAGKIYKSRGALFVETIKRYSENHGIELGFQAGEGL